MNTQTILQMDDKKTKKLIYPEHLPLTKIQAGLKSGKYLQVYNSHSYMLLLDAKETGMKFIQGPLGLMHTSKMFGHMMQNFQHAV